MYPQEPDNVDIAVSTLKAAVVGLQAAKEHNKPLANYIHLVESALDMVKEADADREAETPRYARRAWSSLAMSKA